MSVLGWIFLGLIAGFIGSKIVNREGEGFLLDIVRTHESTYHPTEGDRDYLR